MADYRLLRALRRRRETTPRSGSAVRAVAAMTTLVVMGIAAVGTASPAGAHHGRPYHSESDMVNDSDAANRRTFVLDPGQGQLAGRDHLLAKKGLFEHFGFTENFLWYAPATERPVSAAEPWASCDGGSHADGACPLGSVDTHPSHTVGSTFGQSVNLRLFEYGGAFIARGCGNFSTGSAPRSPVPTIRGEKFRDADRDGARDPGERALAGWQIVVTRVRSDAGQRTGPVAELTTDGNGRYTFALDGHGPGVYRVAEVVPDGWQAYTPATQDVTVPFGAADASYTVDFGNAETTTDVAKTGFRLVDPPDRLEKDEPANLLVRSEIANRGPAGPIEVDEELSIVEQPDDCTIEGLPPRRRRTLDVGGGATFDDTLTVTCTRRSDHRFVFGNAVAVASPEEVTDVDTANNTATVDVTIPVFEQTDLGLDQLHLVCDEYWAGEPFTCTAQARVTNAGSADDAHLLATIALDGSEECTTTPGRTQERPLTLDGTESATVEATWSVSCPDTGLHTFELDAGVAVDEPHLEAEPRSATLLWTPLDVKPNSDPNSLNIGRPGVVSVAVLSTPALDATTAVDPASLRFGPTGTEAPVLRCGSPEDANGDGLADLVCKFALADAGFATGDTLGIVTGTLTSGQAFMAADQVRII